MFLYANSTGAILSATTTITSFLLLVYIDIIIYDTPKNGDRSMCLTLDKSTAIKFAKTLRTEINKIIESEVVDG